MTDEQKELKVQSLIHAARTVLDMFRGGYNPTERQTDALDAAIEGLTALKTCGHVITEDCSCYD